MASHSIAIPLGSEEGSRCTKYSEGPDRLRGGLAKSKEPRVTGNAFDLLALIVGVKDNVDKKVRYLKEGTWLSQTCNRHFPSLNGLCGHGFEDTVSDSDVTWCQ